MRVLPSMLATLLASSLGGLAQAQDEVSDDGQIPASIRARYASDDPVSLARPEPWRGQHRLVGAFGFGLLGETPEMIENAEQRQQDERGYQTAVDEFMLAENEIQEIENSDSARTESAERMGQQTAAMTSVVVTLIFITVMFFNQVW